MHKLFRPQGAPYTASDIRTRRRRLTRGIFLGMITIGLVAALSPILPLYNQLQTYAERLNIAYADATANAVEHRLEAFQHVAEQFASRSEIRRQLEAYTAGEVEFVELAAFTEPRLADAVQSTEHLTAAYRVLPDGRVVAKLGEPVAELEPAQYQASGVWFFPADERDIEQLYLVVTAPVSDAEGQTLAHDVLVFDPRALQRTLISSSEVLQVTDTQACLVHPKTQGHVSFTPGLCEGEPVLNLVDPEVTDTPKVSTHRYNERSMVHFQAPLADTGWHLLMRAPYHQAYHSVWAQLFLVVGVVLIAILIAAIVVRWALRPVLRDLSAQAERVEDSNRELLLADEVFNQSQEAILITEPNLIMVRGNPAFRRLLDLQPEQVSGHSLYHLLAAESKTRDKVAEVTAALDQKDVWQGETWYQTSAGQLPALQTISAVRDVHGDITKLIHIFNDISAERAAMAEIEQAATHDALTGLPNRAGLMTQLQQLIQVAGRRHARFAVLFLDLDRFKPVNDQWGHAAGDQVLRDVGARLQRLTRPGDIVARLGGDEFVVVVPELEAIEQAGAVAGKLLEALNQPFPVADTQVYIGVSIGVAIFPDHGERRTLLLEHADQAMYQAKENGRNCYYFYNDSAAGAYYPTPDQG